jgi:hypothetical protein
MNKTNYTEDMDDLEDRIKRLEDSEKLTKV